MEVEKICVQYMKSWWVSAEIVYDRAKLRWASIIEQQDPLVRILLLVLGDVLGWAFLLLGGACVFLVGILALLLVGAVVLFPFSYLTLYLGRNYLFNKGTLFYGLGALGVSNATLYGLWWLRMPEGDVLRNKYGVETEFSPELLIERFQFVSFIVLWLGVWLGVSVYAAVLCLDFLVIITGFSFTVYYGLYRCYSFLWFLANTIPWYVIVPTAVLTPLLFISLYRRMTREVWVTTKEIWEKRAFEHPSVQYVQLTPSRLPV